MPERLRVFELAKELGTSNRVVVSIAQELQLPVIRGVAQLTARQEQLIRDRFHAKHSRVQRVPPPPPPVVRQPKQEVKYVRCACCELGFQYVIGPDHIRPDWCPHCLSHYEVDNEPEARTISRLSDHVQRTRKAHKETASSAGKYYDDMKRAYESRQKWKIALVDIALGHEKADEGKCSCGANKFPCVTMRALEQSNRGIARQIDRLSSLTPEQLDWELHRDDPWHVDLRVDDDPLSASKKMSE